MDSTEDCDTRGAGATARDVIAAFCTPPAAKSRTNTGIHTDT